MLFGRIGSMGGSNFIGFMLVNYCTTIFYLYGGFLISMCSEIVIFEIFLTNLRLNVILNYIDI